MPPRLQDLLDITTVKTRYTRYLDTKRWQDWAELFTEDVTMHMGEGADDVIQGRQAILDLLLKNIAKATTVHRVHPGEITFTGEDTANVIWPMDDEVESKVFHLRGSGYYEEQYRREGGVWRIARWRLLRTRIDWHAKALPVKLVKFAHRIGLLGLVAPEAAKQFHYNTQAVMGPDDLP